MGLVCFFDDLKVSEASQLTAGNLKSWLHQLILVQTLSPNNFTNTSQQHFCLVIIIIILLIYFAKLKFKHKTLT